MAVRAPLLLSADELAPQYRWRLASSLFAQWRTLVEGAAALAFVQVVGLVHTAWAGFAVLLAGTLAVFMVRAALARRFEAAMRQKPDFTAGLPDGWAARFTLGAVASAGMWAATDLAVLAGFNDPVLQLFVVTVQAGWLGGFAVRNAAAPLAVLMVGCVALLPTALGTLFSPLPLVHLVAPMCLLQFSACWSSARFTGRQITKLMLSEQRLERANGRLLELSTTDGLTGIGNRRSFDVALQAEWARAAREGNELSLIVLDVDRFKAFNDHYGHPAGDDCLKVVAAQMLKMLRSPPDFAARFGGEEFVAVLPGTSETGARRVAERFRQAVLAACVPHVGNEAGYVTVSAGVATMAPAAGDSVQALIDLADRALYCAKHAGRNRVCAAGERPAMELSSDNAGDGLGWLRSGLLGEANQAMMLPAGGQLGGAVP